MEIEPRKYLKNRELTVRPVLFWAPWHRFEPNSVHILSPSVSPGAPTDLTNGGYLRYLGWLEGSQGDRLSMNTVVPSGKDIQRNWHVIDATGAALGRIASQAAHILMGKHKAIYTPYIDMGDHVVIVNAEKVRLTGKKEEQKLYRYHSGYPGGLTEISAKKMRATRPMKMVEEAVKGMLPKSKLGKHMATKLKVYAGETHPHQAQQPVALEAILR